MEITRKADLVTVEGPEAYFNGRATITGQFNRASPARVTGAIVHFEPGARTAWHTHPHGQTILVTHGVGRCQRRGGPVEEIHPGDRVFFEPGEESRSMGTFMILDHIARARRLGLPYVYLGYWIEGSRKMDYKARFLPQQRLAPSGWLRVDAVGSMAPEPQD